MRKTIFSLKAVLCTMALCFAGILQANALENTVATAYTATEALEVIANGEGLDAKVYVKGKISKINEVSPKYGNATFYITDGASELYIYRTYGLNGAKFTSEDDLAVGDNVVLYGQLVNYKGNTPEMTTGGQIVSISGAGKFSEPLFTWTPGKKAQGGYIAYVNSKSNDNLTNSYLCLNGKAENLNDGVASKDAGHALITFDRVLCKGDVLTFTGYADGVSASLYLVFSTGAVVADSQSFFSTDGTISIAVPEAAVGSASVIITRNDANSDLYLTSISCVHNSYAVKSAWLGDVAKDGAIVKLFNPATANFLNQGNAWGTQASRDAAGLRFNLSEESEGIYKIVTCNYPDRQLGWDNGSGFYVDITNQAETRYQFVPVETADAAQNAFLVWVESKVSGNVALTGYLTTSEENTVVDVKAEADEYCIWQIQDETKKVSLENKFAALKAGAYKPMALQTSDETAAGYLWSNAPDQAEGLHPEYMLDGDVNTFFHSDWHGVVSDPHYLEVDLGAGQSISEFAISYTRRMNNNNNRPTEIIIEGSNDGETFTAIRTLTEAEDGLPTVAGNDSYTSPFITAAEAYRYLRFTISQTNNATIFFTFSEFGLVTKSANYNLINVVSEQIQAVLDDENADDQAYADAEAFIQEVLDGKYTYVESTMTGDKIEAANLAGMLYNPASACFLNQGNDWGTQASLGETGLAFYLSQNPEGLYKIVTRNYSSQQFGWDKSAAGNLYVDITNQANSFFKIEPVQALDPSIVAYTIYMESTGSDGSTFSGYLSANGSNTVVGITPEKNDYSVWQFVDETQKWAVEDAKLELKAAINEVGAGAFEKLALQTEDATAAGYLWSNAPDQAEGLHPEYMLDGDVNTFFHSDWHNVVTDPHYLEVDMGEGKSISEFSLSYTRRMNNNNNRATEIIIEGSNDGENFTAIRTLTEAEDGLPTLAGNDSYTSPLINCGAEYRYIRFTISKVNNGTIFFTFSEFGLGVKGAHFNSLNQAQATAQAVLDNEKSTLEEIQAATAYLQDVMNGKYALIDTPWAGDAINAANMAGQFYNPASANFLNQGNDWGTQATRAEEGLSFNLTQNEEGLYKIVTRKYAGQQFGWDKSAEGKLYVDITNQANSFFKFETVKALNPDAIVYTIWMESTASDGSTLSGYLAANGENTVVGIVPEVNDYCYWQFVDETEKCALEDAKVELQAAIGAASAQAYASLALQTSDATAAGYLWSNAPDQAEGLHPEYMLDGDVNTFFHSDWHGVVSDPHYLEVDLGAGQSISEFAISYTRRMNNNNNRPTEIIIEGSNDGETFTAIRTLTEAEDGLPTVAGNDSYTSPFITAAEAYRYLRFTISQTNNATIFFTFSEFGLVTKSANYNLINVVSEQIQAVLDDENADDQAYADAEAFIQEVLDGKYTYVESTMTGDKIEAANLAGMLYNPASACFLNQGNDWGTQASLGETGLAFYLSQNPEGLYKIVTRNYSSQQFGWDKSAAGNLYVDITNQANSFFKIEPVQALDPSIVAYTIYMESTGSDGSTFSGYLSANGSNTVVGITPEKNDYSVWQFVDETQKWAVEDAKLELKAAINEVGAGAFEKLALQTEDATAAGYLWSNAPDQAEGLHPEYMLDGDVNTFFHSDWHNVVTDPHYLEVDMGEGKSISEFSLSYTRRMNNNNNRATEIIIEGSNDGENFTAIRTLTEAEDGLPTLAGNDSYTSPLINCGAEYRYIRFTISKVNNGTIFFTFSEFGLGVKGNRFGIVTSAVAAAQAVLDDESATIADIQAAKAALAEALESKIADGTYYLINNASGKFLSRGAGWGTQACLADFGLPFNVSTDAEGIIRLSSIDMPDQRLSYVDGTFNGSYVDGDGRDSNFRVLATDNGYIFKNDAAGYLGIEPDAATKAWYGVGAHASEAEALTFELLSADEYEAIIAANFKAGKDAAAAAAGIDDADYAISNWYAIDATSNVKSAALVGGYDGWTWKNFGDLGLNRGGGLASNENGTECYEGSGILSQVVEGLTPGFYKVTLNGFYRTNWERTVNVDWCENGWFVSTAYLQANGNKVRIKPVGEEASINEAGDNIYPNWMNESKDCFDRGLYLNEVYACVGADGKLEVSINIPSWASQCWLMFNNLKLYRYSSEPEAIDGDATGIQAVAAEAGTSTIFNANGAQVAEPVKGVNIVKTVMSDGSVKVEKIFVK